MTWRVICADVLAGLTELEDVSVQTVVTSPPYWGLRDYGEPGQLGLEPTPEAYVERMVEVFRDVRRALRDDGTVWLNLGDSYTNAAVGSFNGGKGQHEGAGFNKLGSGLKPKDLVGIPWRVAFALQADGWYLRSDIIWAKPNPMPESVTDRPTKSHEYVFLLSKSPRYFFDADAVREAAEYGENRATFRGGGSYTGGRSFWNASRADGDGEVRERPEALNRNIRTVWNIATEPFPGAHFATFPKALVTPCVKAGTSERGCCGECGQPFERKVSVEPMVFRPSDRQAFKREAGNVTEDGLRTTLNGTLVEPAKRTTTGWATSCGHTGEPVPCLVLDPFAGSGTVGVVAARLGRSFVGIELSPEYAAMARDRIRDDAPMFNTQTEAV